MREGGPAFPSTADIVHVPDMSLRDWFVGMIASGWLGNPGFEGVDGSKLSQSRERSLQARSFYELADAMLAERDKKAVP